MSRQLSSNPHCTMHILIGGQLPVAAKKLLSKLLLSTALASSVHPP